MPSASDVLYASRFKINGEKSLLFSLLLRMLLKYIFNPTPTMASSPTVKVSVSIFRMCLGT